MNIIVPMAGMGKRLRPHTLTVPKPLVPIAGKPIVQRLVEDIAAVCNEKIDNIGFVTGHFGQDVESHLLAVAQSVGAQGHIFYQDEALGTAHAVYCAESIMSDNVIVAFADTLFRADFKLDVSQDGIIWVKKVEDPSAFGVVKLNEQNQIVDFVEKPSTFVSDLAIIGIYFFKDGEQLKKEIAHVIDNNIMAGGEYQLTTVLDNLKDKGVRFKPGEVSDWLDCGNKNATVDSNKRYLEFLNRDELVHDSVESENSVIIPPVFVGKDVTLKNTVVGPHVSIGDGCTITNSRIENSIVQSNSKLDHVNLENSMVGNFVSVKMSPRDLSVGDYTDMKV
ncbi:MAG: sugar phosphate nucleotidyltransferase [Bacteroidota bacterium]